MRARSLSFPASLSWIPGVLQQQANKAWREKENAFKTNCRQFQGRRKKEERPADGRSSGPCASAPSSSDREPVKKKGSKSWSTPVCDCLEKESKTVILSDNSNEPELRARSDKATTTRCRKQKLLRLRQRCTGSAVVHGQPFHGVTCVLLAGACACGGCNWLQTGRVAKQSCEISPLYAHRARAWLRTSTRQKRALSLPSIGKEGADSLSKGIFLPMGDHGRLGSLRRAFSPL